MAAPEKPTLDGLEAKWDARWQEQGTYRFDRTRPRERSTRSTPRRRPSAARCTWARSSATRRPTRSRGSSGCAAARSSTRWAGTTTACPPSAGCRTTTASAAIRPALRPGLRRRPRQPGQGRRAPISRRNFVELCQRLTAEDEQAFEELWRRLGLSVDWSHDLHDDRRPRPARRAAGVPAQPRPRRGLPAEAPTLWDVDFRTAVAQAELEDREQPGAYHRIAFHGPDGGRCSVETTRPELLPACVALVAHPDDERYQPLFGTDGAHARCSASRCRCSRTSWPTPTRAPASRWSARSATLTDVTWWRELHLPTRVDDRPRRAVRGRAARLAGRRRRARRASARRPDRDRRRGGPSSSCCASRATLARRAAPDHAPGEVLREGRPRRSRSSRSRQWYCATAAATPTLREPPAGPRPRAALAPPTSCGRGTSTGSSGLQRRLAGQPAAVLRRAVPGLVPRSTSDGEPDYDEPLLAPTSRLAGRPVSRRARPATPRRSAACRAASSADPDVMDTWATSSLTPQIAGGWERRPGPVRPRLPDGPAAAGPTRSSAPGCSPPCAVAPRARRRCRGRTPRSTAGSSTPTARRCRSRRATSSPRSPCSSEYGSDARALLGGQRPARHRHRRRRRRR